MEYNRRNTKGYKLLPHSRGSVHLLVVPSGCKLLNDRGQEITTPDEYMNSEAAHVVGKKNLVIWDDGKKDVGDFDTTVMWLKGKDVEQVVVL
jgi:hypothetical protein